MKRHMMHPYMQAQERQRMAEERAAREAAEAVDSPLAEECLERDAADRPEAARREQQSVARDDAAVPETGADEKSQIEEMRLRMAAEMDNFKKRLAREHQEQMRYASEKVLSDLLPALDNLDLALQYGSQHAACKDMMQGIELTRRQLLDAVAKSGLTSVGQAGELFNPEIHEAIGVEENPGLEKGAVSRVLQRGYKLNDRLLRPAKVMVNS